MSLLQRVEEANDGRTDELVPFFVEHRLLGYLLPENARVLLEFAHVFRRDGATLRLARSLEQDADTATRSQAMERVMRTLRERRLVRGWRDEPFAIASRFGEPPAFLLERAALPLFGARGYGVHINGFVRCGGEKLLWVGVRAKDKPTYPGRLDQVVAGGQPAGLSVRENLTKECEEEAGISAELASTAVPVGTISYCMATPLGVRPDTLFVFDLELPPEFEPQNTDGEVDRFELWSMGRIEQTLRESTAFKTNCALVFIDFLVRHGHLGPESNDYERLVGTLRGTWPPGHISGAVNGGGL
jgi:8-oxo-dGTP pyrophosphatase MutT (NUDIX family)